MFVESCPSENLPDHCYIVPIGATTGPERFHNFNCWLHIKWIDQKVPIRVESELNQTVNIQKLEK